MIIAFENLFGRQYEGGANWLEITLYGLGLLPEPPRCLVLDSARDILPKSLRDAGHVESVPLARPNQSRIGKLAGAVARRALRKPWEDGALTDLASRYKVDLWVGFCGFGGLGPNRTLMVWYPDFQFRQLPELFSDEEVLDRERQWNYVARRANAILVISEAVRTDALATHPEVSRKMYVCPFPPLFEESLLTVVPNEARVQYHLPENFFLVCNQFWSHKNHALILRALNYLQKEGRTPPTIAFTGRTYDYRNPEAFGELLGYINRHNLHPYCRFLGVLPREEQIALIRACTAVIQPSRFEGRGAIVEESHVLGKQVLCSDIPVHKELNAPGTLFFPVDGVSELANLLQRNYERTTKPVETIARESSQLLFEYGKQVMRVCRLLIDSSNSQLAATSNYAVGIKTDELY